MPTLEPNLTLNNGVSMPALGLGVYQSPPEVTTHVVQTAIEAGYRLIDTASAYANEREVGAAIARATVDRGELFVTTKLWISDYGYESALRAFDVSMRKLGLDYLDLYLLHWPMPDDFEATIASYTAAEQLLSDGRVRAIGVCNHKPEHLDALVGRVDVVPAVNQVELHPYFAQPEVVSADSAHGVITQAWSPIGGRYVYGPKDPDNVKNVLEDPAVVAIAHKHAKTPAQVVLRWQVQCGRSAIPKSVRPERIAENIDIFDFALTPEELASIDALDTGVRGGYDPSAFNLKVFPATIPD
ncbi:MAG: oxidoreductase [Nocardioidaceae bacterium]|nr:oxidoreductase [Nocardioidaceae bacterium]